MNPVENPGGPGAPGEIDNEAQRAARLVRENLDWDDAFEALVRAALLLQRWRREQPHPHSS
jgi:hypothetical protein